MQNENAVGYEGRQLIAFFKGTAAEFIKLSSLAPNIMAMAANMRNSVSPLRLVTCKSCDGRGWHSYQNGPDDFDKETCNECSGTGKVVSHN